MAKKHYIIVSVTLGAIAASAAALIGLTNFITRNRIEENKKIKIQEGIAEIFGKEASIKNEYSIEKNDYQYVNYVYEIQKDNTIGYAFKSEGSNMYGKISLIVGFDAANNFVSLNIVEDEQTYATALEDDYIAPVNGGSRDINDVNCGATFGAKLVRDMVNEAKKANEEKVWIK